MTADDSANSGADAGAGCRRNRLRSLSPGLLVALIVGGSVVALLLAAVFIGAMRR